MLSIDGQDDYEIADGDEITVRRSPYQARFLHLRPPGYFYRMLQEMLGGTRRHPDLPGDDGEESDPTLESQPFTGGKQETRQ